MVATFSRVVEELNASITRLEPTQHFQVVLFGETPGDQPDLRRPPLTPDDAGLIRATPENKQAVARWLDTLVVRGRSTPLRGLRAALAYQPELVFLLSRSIARSGPEAVWGVGVDRILADLDQRNPIDPATGLRAVVIKTIQFIDPDPSGVMEQIGIAHGDGQVSHSLLTIGDLDQRSNSTATQLGSQIGIESSLATTSNPPPSAADRARTATIDTACETAESRLNPVFASGDAWVVLLGLPTAIEKQRVFDAAESALAALATAPPSTARADPRLPLLRGNASLLRAAAAPPDRVDIPQSSARAAVAELSLRRTIEPEASVQHRITLAIASFLAAPATGSAAGAAGASLASLIDELPLLEVPIQLETLALITATRLGLEQADFKQPRDPFLASLAVQAVVAASLDQRSNDEFDDGESHAESLSPLINQWLAGDEGSGVRIIEAIDIAAGQAAAGTRGPHANLPSSVVRLYSGAIAHRSGRVNDAVAMLIDAHVEHPPLLFDAASLLLESGQPAQAASLFQQFADLRTEDAMHRPAVALAVANAADRTAAVRWAIGVSRQHPSRTAWLIEIAEADRNEDALASLARVPPDDPLHPAAERIAFDINEELLARDPADAVLLARAAELATRLQSPAAPKRRLQLAEALVETEPARARSAAIELLRSGPHNLDATTRARFVLARATEQLSGDPFEAFTLYEQLVTSTQQTRLAEPARSLYWHALTRTMELASEHGDAASVESARRKIIRVQADEPSLGGEPWKSRITRLLSGDDGRP
ncbi:MAG: hypothetical protein AAF235_05295 [Planctomycetota bacterium]